MAAVVSPDRHPPYRAPGRHHPPRAAMRPARLQLVTPGFVAPPPARRVAPEIYRRRRLVVAALAAVALTVAAGVVVLAVEAMMGRDGVPGPVGRPVAARVWTVHPGDTLWSIAAASGDRGDLRPLVDELSAEVHGQPLQVGELISVP